VAQNHEGGTRSGVASRSEGDGRKVESGSGLPERERRRGDLRQPQERKPDARASGRMDQEVSGKPARRSRGTIFRFARIESPRLRILRLRCRLREQLRHRRTEDVATPRSDNLDGLIPHPAPPTPRGRTQQSVRTSRKRGSWSTHRREVIRRNENLSQDGRSSGHWNGEGREAQQQCRVGIPEGPANPIPGRLESFGSRAS